MNINLATDLIVGRLIMKTLYFIFETICKAIASPVVFILGGIQMVIKVWR